MNHNLKLAVTAAVAAMGMVGQAHALVQSTVSTSGSMFLYAFEDRQANTLATNSAIFDLGLASAFNTASNQTFDFSTNSAWNTYIASVATPANIHWGVFGVSVGVGGTGTNVLTTQSVNPAAGTFNGAAISAFAVNSNAEIPVYGGATCTSCGFSVVTNNDLATAAWDDNAGGIPATLTAGLGSSMDFFKYVSNGTKSSTNSTKTALPSTFTLSNTGVLTYAVAAVPEANTYAMMLAGLGLVGFMVRRRGV